MAECFRQPLLVDAAGTCLGTGQAGGMPHVRRWLEGATASEVVAAKWAVPGRPADPFAGRPA